MVQYRGLCALTLGIWLGAGILADVAVTRNFQAVDRFLANPGTAAAATELDRVGRPAERAILRRNAAEENAWIFADWERAELVLGSALFVLLLAGNQPRKLFPALCLAMLLMVAAQHFFLTDSINELGRRVDDLPPSDPAVRHFWILHGLYSGLDLLKLAVGFALAAGLTFQKAARNQPGSIIDVPNRTGQLTRG